MKIYIKIIFCLILSSPFLSISAQEDESYYEYSSERKIYELGGIKIVGAGSRDTNAIKSITGLRVGGRIEIGASGGEIPRAIKSLMKLRLFENVYIYQDSIVDDQVIFLVVELEDKPTLSKFSYKGVKKNHHDDLNEIVNGVMTKEGIVTDDQKNLVQSRIRNFYHEKGMLDATVRMVETKDPDRDNSISIEFDVEPHSKVKIREIIVNGNDAITDKKIRKKLKSTKQKNVLFKKSKLINEDFEEDKKNLIAYYNTKGYKDARIISDSIWRNDEGMLVIELNIFEGAVFKYGKLNWKGHTLYTPEQLNTILGIGTGDVYNPELLEQRLRFSQDGRDISSLYLDVGYLSFSVNPVEIAVHGDSIDLEMRIFEGPKFTIGDVEINGNDRTHEHVIRRTVRTKPGKQFSRKDIIRSNREIVALGYFNPENLDIQTPVNENLGTVDIVYNLEEKSSDQLELSAGYGAFQGLIGTLGVTFNNFSIKNVRDRSTWSPLPQGDGQKLSLRAQSNSRFFKSYNFSFTEPWLGGKKPNSFTIGGANSSFDYSLLGSGKFKITRLFAGLGSQLRVPDDFFSSSTTLSFDNIVLDDYSYGTFGSDLDGEFIPIKDGQYHNLAIKQVISRSSVSDPLFPRSGSSISLAVQFSPPYSLFRKIDDYVVSEEEVADITKRLSEELGPGAPPTAADIKREVDGIRLSKKFNWLEYHKWQFNSEWYFNIAGKLVLKAQAKMGLMGSYNKSIGVIPFERFNLGGDGLSNQNNQISGIDLIALRGYAETDFPLNQAGGATVYDKFTLELRYPLSLNPSSTIYVTSFFQAGNQWNKVRDFNPFDVKRTVGLGARVFLPMFGLLGFDYGFGFDKSAVNIDKWSDYGKFSIIIGFEPE